jgi:predicted metallo-beta-lactamase superfamily hydrolase
VKRIVGKWNLPIIEGPDGQSLDHNTKTDEEEAANNNLVMIVPMLSVEIRILHHQMS